MKSTGRCYIMIGAIASFLFFASCATEANARQLDVYVSPAGSDTASGNSSSEALRSLGSAMRWLGRAQSGDTVHVHLAAGNQEPATLVWRVPAGVKVILAGTAGQTIFDGGGSDRYWAMLELNNPRSEIVVGGLVIRGYRGGIFIRGGGREGGRVTITDNQFANIGQSSLSMEAGYAAIGLKNGYGNLITRNLFTNISNVDATRCEGMHAVYLADGSNANVVRDNRFDGGCGDTIKVRNGSNANVIESNQFLNQKASWFADTYCDKVNKNGCTREECPSWDNSFLNNSGDPGAPVARRIRVLSTPPGPSCTERGTGTRVKLGAEDANRLKAEQGR